MTATEILAIANERLPRWIYGLAQDHATPIAVVGIGHDAQAGTITVYAPDEPEMTNQVVAAFCRKAAILLDPEQKGAVP